MWYERAEIGFFWGTRYNFDKFGADDVKGWSNLIGGDVRFNLGEHVDIGASGMVRVGTDADTLSWAGGPTVTVAPMKNAHIIRSEEHTSELQSLMRISYAVFCLKETKNINICRYIQNTIKL